MGPSCKSACLLFLGLYIPFQLVETFYFNLADNDQNEQNPVFFGPLVDMDRPIRIDNENVQEYEMNSSQDNFLAGFFPPVFNKTQESDLARLRDPGIGCNDVHEEKYRCCRVFDQVAESWWCSDRRPFCCHQGTACAVCCTADELRQTEGQLSPVSCRHTQQRAPTGHRQPPPPAVDGNNWFWNGMKAAWMTMFVVIMASVCCTCLAYKCIKYLVTIVNDEASDAEEEYLAYHFESLGLVGAEERQVSRQVAPHGLLPPKYSDINFTPVQPEAAVAAIVPGEPPPHYTSEAETELQTETAPTETELQTQIMTDTRTDTRTNTSRSPPAGDEPAPSPINQV